MVKLYNVIVLLINDISHSRCFSINVRENRSGNHEWTTERHRLHRTRDTKRGQTKQKPPHRKLKKWSIRTIPVMFFLNKTTAMLLKAIIKAREKIHCHLSNEYFVTSNIS